MKLYAELASLRQVVGLAGMSLRDQVDPDATLPALSGVGHALVPISRVAQFVLADRAGAVAAGLVQGPGTTK